MGKFEKIALYGESESGKSTMMNRILRPHKRVIVFDPLRSRVNTAGAERLQKIEDINELRDAVRKNYRIGFRYWFKPENDEDFLILSLSDLSKFMTDFQDQHADKYGEKNTADMFLGVDEMADCYPNYSLPKKLNGFSRMCRSGRHSNVHLVGATQRPAEVSTKFRGQIRKRVFFRLSETVDYNAVRAMVGEGNEQVAEDVRNLQQLEYIRMENGGFTRGRLTFP